MTYEYIGEGKLEELLEEMPTGQEELTRERRERLKEVKPFFFDIGIKMETLFLSLWCVMDT